MKFLHFFISLLVHIVAFAGFILNPSASNKTDSTDIIVVNSVSSSVKRSKMENSVSTKVSSNKNEIEKKQVVSSIESGSSTTESLERNLNEFSGVGGQDSEIEYLIRQLYQKKFYPTEAIRKKQQGAVKLKFKVGGDGKLIDISILEPSPYFNLNAAALTALNRIELDTSIYELQKLFQTTFIFTYDFVID